MDPMLDVTPATLLSPPLRRTPGRLRKNRKREADEGAHSSQTRRTTTFKCSICEHLVTIRELAKEVLSKKKRGDTFTNQVVHFIYIIHEMLLGIT